MKNALLSFGIGFSAILLMAMTSDQILQDVYTTANGGSLQVTLSGGAPASSITVGSTTISGGTTGRILYDNAAVLGELAIPLNVATGGTGAVTLTSHGVVLGQGTSAVAITAAGTTGQVLTSNGASADPTYQTPGASSAAPVAILLPNSGSTGTTVNKLAKVNSDGTVVVTPTSATVGALGVVTAGAGTTGSATIQLIGATTCVFDNSVTAGDFIGISSGTAGDCTDLGSTFPSDKAVLGIVTDTAAAGTRNVILQTPDIMNTTNIKGGNPGKGNITNLIYTGTLSIQDIHADNASFTVAHRWAYVTTGASAIAATMPASPTVGDTYSITKADNGAGTVVWTRAGSQTLNGATSRTLSTQYKSDTCIYMATNVWICQGDAV